MSYKTTDTITCPTCGNKQKIIMWSVVDSDVNTRMHQKVLNGTFFEFKCKCCGKISTITYNTLYEDNTNHTMIYYTQTMIGVAEANQVISERRRIVNDRDDYNIRIVTSPNALREKVRIFDQGFDDRIIEVMKALILEELGNKKAAGHVEEILCWVRMDGNFDISVLSEHPGSMMVKRDFYDYVEKKVKRLLDKQYPNPTEVGLDMAFEFLDRNHFHSN